MKFGIKTRVVNISNDVLHNRFVLYFIFGISISSLFYSVFVDDLLSVGVFLVTSLLTSFFSKNMIVILVVAIVVSSVIRLTYKTQDNFFTVEDDVEGFKGGKGGKGIGEKMKNITKKAAGLAGGGVLGAVLGGGDNGGGECCSDVRQMVLDIETLKRKVTEMNEQAEQKNMMTDFDMW